MPAGDPSPSHAAAVNEQRLLLAEVLEQLPDDYRQVLILRHKISRTPKWRVG